MAPVRFSVDAKCFLSCSSCGRSAETDVVDLMAKCRFCGFITHLADGPTYRAFLNGVREMSGPLLLPPAIPKSDFVKLRDEEMDRIVSSMGVPISSMGVPASSEDGLLVSSEVSFALTGEDLAAVEAEASRSRFTVLREFIALALTSSHPRSRIISVDVSDFTPTLIVDVKLLDFGGDFVGMAPDVASYYLLIALIRYAAGTTPKSVKDKACHILPQGSEIWMNDKI